MAKAVARDGNWVRDLLKRKEVLCYLDIDIDGAHASTIEPTFQILPACIARLAPINHELTTARMRL